MNGFPVSSPQTIFDWVALRDEFRDKIELLDLISLSILFGLSKTSGHQDDDFVRRTEAFLSKSINPVRMRFDLASSLGSTFWDYFDEWRFEHNQAGKPGYVGDLVDGFHEIVLAWLLEGLATYSNDPDVMDSAYFLVSRIGNFDTFLDEEDIPMLESAAQKEISLKTSPGGRQLMERFQEFHTEQFNDSEMENNQSEE